MGGASGRPMVSECWVELAPCCAFHLVGSAGEDPTSPWSVGVGGGGELASVR